MMPEEIKPTEAQKARVEERGYRAFLITDPDGSQQLITIYRDSHLAHVAERTDKWATWSAPYYLQEIWE